jgi:hypothetical protein
MPAQTPLRRGRCLWWSKTRCLRQLTAKEPNDKGNDRGDDDACHDRKEEDAAVRFDVNVPWQAPEPKARKPWPRQSQRRRAAPTMIKTRCMLHILLQVDGAAGTQSSAGGLEMNHVAQSRAFRLWRQIHTRPLTLLPFACDGGQRVPVCANVG